MGQERRQRRPKYASENKIGKTLSVSTSVLDFKNQNTFSKGAGRGPRAATDPSSSAEVSRTRYPPPTHARSVTSRMVFPPLPSSKPGPTAPYSRSPIDDAYLSSGRPDVDVSHRGWVKLRWHGGSFFASSSSGVLALADSSAPSGRLPRPQTGLGEGGRGGGGLRWRNQVEIPCWGGAVKSYFSRGSS